MILISEKLANTAYTRNQPRNINNSTTPPEFILCRQPAFRGRD